jgi:hypothetical protein
MAKQSDGRYWLGKIDGRAERDRELRGAIEALPYWLDAPSVNDAGTNMVRRDAVLALLGPFQGEA